MKAGIVSSISFAMLLVLAVSSGYGCGPDQNVYGRWEGDRDWKSLNLTSEEVARALAAINLTLKGDRTFLLQDGGVPFEGTWTQSGDTLNLTVERIMNRNLEQQQESVKKQAVFKVRYKDGVIYFQSPGDSKEIELKKKTKPAQ